MKIRKLVVGVLVAGVSLIAAGCGPTSVAPPPRPWCDLDVRFDDNDVAHVHGETNLPGGTVLRVVLDGNGAPYAEDSITITGSGSADDRISVPDWGYPVAWDVTVFYRGAVLCTDWATQGARYITDPEWWELCTPSTDPECAYEMGLQTNPTQ